jgi:glycosyltransferase involved in cell wall biosynthesis
MIRPYTIVIPAYNEEKRIGKVLAEIAADRGEFIVVCDGTDKTEEIVRKFSGSRPELDLTCLSYNRRLGKGGAVREGFSHAGSPVVGYMDADGSTSLAQVHRLIEALDGGDVVIGSRWLPGSVIPERQGLSRRIESRVFNLVIRLLFGLRFTDTQCGAKVFKKSAVDAVLTDMTSTGFEFDVELLWRLSKKGYRVLECPITWQNKGDSRVTAGDAIRMLSGLIALRIHGGTLE